MKIAFLGIGVQKGATTWLRHNLEHHPEIYVPHLEPHYFNRYQEYKKGYEYYHRRWFSNATSNQLCGEITPNYCYFPGTAERIYDYNPNIKLILLLRHPVDRAISQYQMEVAKALWNPRRKGGTLYANQCGLKKAFDYDLAHIRSYGLYVKQILQYQKVFGENLLINMYHEIVKTPQQLLDHVCWMLGVSQMKFKDAHRKVQTVYSQYPKKNEVVRQLRKDVSIRSDHIDYVRDYYKSEVATLKEMGFHFEKL